MNLSFDKLLDKDLKMISNEVINEMICNAWYSVREFHIHLSGIQADGQVRDGLERAVLTLSDLSDLPSNASRIEIKNAIHEYDTELRSAKEARIRAMYDEDDGVFGWDPEHGYWL